MNPDQSETLILDVRERLARIEVKIDNTNETLRNHDRRINDNREDIDTLKGEVVAYKAKTGTYAKLGAGLAAAGGLFAWFLDHAQTVAAVGAATLH